VILSPYPLVIAMEVLIQENAANQAGKIRCHPYCAKIQLNHVSFAGDQMLSFKGDASSSFKVL